MPSDLPSPSCCNFRNGGEYEGLNSMPQPETDIQLFSGDTGMVGRTFAVRSYGVRLLLLPPICYTLLSNGTDPHMCVQLHVYSSATLNRGCVRSSRSFGVCCPVFLLPVLHRRCCTRAACT